MAGPLESNVLSGIRKLSEMLRLLSSFVNMPSVVQNRSGLVKHTKYVVKCGFMALTLAGNRGVF